MPTRIVGDKELQRKINRIINLGRTSELYPALMKGAVDIYGEASKYPAISGQKREGGPGSSWYVRGQGSKYKRKDGTIRSYNNSEDLGQSWTMKGQQSPPKITIGNDTSYGIWVKDPEKQSRVMKGFNWKNTDEDVKKREKEVLREIQKKVDSILAGR